MPSLERDLAAFYDRDAERRRGAAIQPERVARREAFADLLLAEGRRSVVEVGTGPGIDAAALAARGLEVTGVDLSAEHVRMCREAGSTAYVASVLHLPFADDVFDAGFTMSTLLHVRDEDVDGALAEIARVLVPGAPLAVGVWGGADGEFRAEGDTVGPRRLFVSRSDDTWRATLGRHGEVETFETWQVRDETYQWAVVRVGGGY